MIIFFDLETTGVSTTKDRIVQLSAVKVDSAYNIIPGTKKTILINPTIPIPKEASDVHGVTDEMVKDKPVFAAYATSMHAYFSNCILAGFNVKRFDVPLLSEEFGRCNLSWPAPGALILDAYNIFKIKEKRDLAAAVKFYTGETIEGAHDAENDNLATLKVFKGQMEMYADLKTLTLAELHDFCCDDVRTLDLAGKIGLNDAGEAVYLFGKDIGKVVKKEPGFAQWMLRNDFPQNTKDIINIILKP